MKTVDHVYGIDIGGTKMELVACDPAWQVLHRKRVNTPVHDYADFLDTLTTLVHETDQLLGTGKAIGIGVPGLIDGSTGKHLSSNVPALNGQILLPELHARFQRRIVLGNDCQCFALSEAHGGAAQGKTSMFGAILGTGVGGGYCVNGQLIRGSNGLAGEWGHSAASAVLLAQYRLPTLACGCGLSGCLERYVSGKGVSELYRHLTENHTAPSPDARTIADLFRQGDPVAVRTFDIHLDLLAQGIASLVMTLDPHIIVLGGGLSQLAHLYTSLPAAVSRHLFKNVRVPPIVPPVFGDAGGARGAALLTRQAYDGPLFSS